MPCQFLIDGSLCKGLLGGYKDPNEYELKAYCNGDFKACLTYQIAAEHDPRSIKKEEQMAGNEVFRVLYCLNPGHETEKTLWGIKDCLSKRAVELWIEDHLKSRLIRFVTSSQGETNRPFDSMEAAKAYAEEHGNCQIQPVSPGDDVSHQGVELVYKLLQREVK